MKLPEHSAQPETLPIEPSGDYTSLPEPIQKTMVYSTIEGSFAQIFTNLTAGSVITGFMYFLGASTYQVTILAGVPLLAQVMSPVAVWLEGRLPRRRQMTTLLLGWGRVPWLFVPFLLLLPIVQPFGTEALLISVFLSYIFIAGGSTLWTAWMADVVPERFRGCYFGKRVAVVGVVGVVATVASGWFLDLIAPPYNFLWALVFAGVCAVVCQFLLTKHHDPKSPIHRQTFGEVVLGPWRDQNFKRFLLFAGVWQGSVFLGAPLVYPFMLKYLRMSFTEIALLIGLTSLVALAVGPIWGKLADQVGHRQILIIFTVLCGLTLPGCWLLATPEDHRFFWLGCICDGIVWSAITPAIFNLTLSTAAKSNRVAYISVYSYVTGIAGFAGSLIAGELFVALEPLQTQVLGREWTAYHWMFLLTMVLRSTAFLWLGKVKEPEHFQYRRLYGEMRNWRLGWFPWR